MRYWKDVDGKTFVKLTSDVRLAIYRIMALIGADLTNPAVLFPKMHFFGMYEREAHTILLDVYLEAARDQIDRISQAIQSLRFILEAPQLSQKQATLHDQMYQMVLTEYDANNAQLESHRPLLREAQISCVQTRVQHSIKRSWELKVESVESLQSMKNYDEQQHTAFLSRRAIGVLPRKLLPSQAAVHSTEDAFKTTVMNNGDTSDYTIRDMATLPLRTAANKDSTKIPRARQRDQVKVAENKTTWQRYDFYVPPEHHAAAAAGI